LDVCRRFSDDLTLDNLSRPQLVTLCRFMGVNAFGTDNFLRFVLRRQMRGISSDDRVRFWIPIHDLPQNYYNPTLPIALKFR
jgi:hypothetical protein